MPPLLVLNVPFVGPFCQLGRRSWGLEAIKNVRGIDDSGVKYDPRIKTELIAIIAFIAPFA